MPNKLKGNTSTFNMLNSHSFCYKCTNNGDKFTKINNMDSMSVFIELKNY